MLFNEKFEKGNFKSENSFFNFKPNALETYVFKI